MKHKQTTLTFLLIILGTALQAQYDLSDFKVQNFQYNALDTRFSFNQSNQHQGASNIVGTLGNQSFSDFSGNTVLNYLGYSNSPTQQISTVSELNVSGIISDRLNVGQTNRKVKTLLSDLYLNSSYRSYYDASKYFFEYGINADFTRNTTKSDIRFIGPTGGTVTAKDSSKFTNLSTTLILKTGSGRIDPVTDARHAIFILNKLKEENRITHDLSPEGLREFVQLVADLKNKRFFDFRLRQIYELEAIDSFFQSKNLISNPDIRYFTTLSDRWRFANGPNRFSGKRFSLAFLPGYNRLHQMFVSQLSSNIVDLKISNAYIHSGLEFINEKPLNLYTQSTFEMFGYLGFVKGKINTSSIDFPTTTVEESQKIFLPKSNIGIIETLGFYPNTRTSMQYSVSVQYAKTYDFFNADENNFEVNVRGLRVDSDVRISYYFSPRLRATGRASVSYAINNSDASPSDSPDSLINRNFLFLSNTPNCGSQNCNDLFSERKNYRTQVNLSLSYGFF